MNKGIGAPVYGADAGDVFTVAHLLQQQPISDLSGEHAGVDVFQLEDALHHFGSCYFGFGTSHHCWSNTACLIVPECTILISIMGSAFYCISFN